MITVKIFYEDNSITINDFANNSTLGKFLKAAKEQFVMIPDSANTNENRIYKAFTYKVKKTGIDFLWITEHSGKLEGIYSISTSCQLNKICMERAKDPNSICSSCYADSLLDMREGLREHVERNYHILNAGIIPKEFLPEIYTDIFRLESFGDVASVECVINYFNICNKNKKTQFTVWTKNYFFYHQAVKMGYKKPKNLILIVSSPYTNIKLDINKFPLADKIFTVYDKKYIKENGIDINCGGLSCRGCMKCYKRNDKHKYISEKKK